MGFSLRGRMLPSSCSLLVSGALLCSCAAIDLGTIGPPAINLVGSCGKAAGPASDAAAGSSALTQAVVPSLMQASSATDVDAEVRRVDARLPGSLSSDPVVKSLTRIVAKAALKGHAAGLAASNGKTLDQVQDAKTFYALTNSEQTELQAAKLKSDLADSLKVPGHIKQGEMKRLARTLLKHQSSTSFDFGAPGAAPLVAADHSQLGQYLSAYFDGKYTDIYGAKVAKPTLNMTISDTEINGLVTILLDYIVDQFNVTVVLGSDPTPGSGTKYYLGGVSSTAEPTFLTLNPSAYEQIPATTTKCEWAADNVLLLTTFANTAGSQAALAGGLVTQSAGGFEVGLGFLGKFSVGDNQTLSGVVKTAASRAANRAALAALFWAVETRHRQGG